MGIEKLLTSCAEAGENFPEEVKGLGVGIKINPADGKAYLAKDNASVVGVLHEACTTDRPIMSGDMITYIQEGRANLYVDPAETVAIKRGEKVGISAKGFAKKDAAGKFEAMSEGTPGGMVWVNIRI